MMTRRTALTIIVVSVTAGASFALTWAARSRPPASAPVEDSTAALMQWLNLSEAQQQEISRRDQTFSADLKRLREDVARCRSELASTLEQSDAPDEQITARVEALLAASNSLERRITRFLLAVRDQLTPSQRRQLFQLCAQGVREGPGWRHRFGQASPPGRRGFGPEEAPGQRGPAWGRTQDR